MDRITNAHRSWNMSRIRSKDTQPEIIVRRFLYRQGVRYRLHAKLPGRPDILIRKKRIAIFVNGCFWHAHSGCPDFRWPKTRTDFWKIKIEGNIKRDQANYAKLKDAGWQSMIVWECELKRNSLSTLHGIYQNISSTLG